MSILIISNSLVVEEVFKIALANKNIQMEFVKNVEDANEDSYSVIFLDEGISNIKEQINIIDNYIDYSELVAIANNEKEYTDFLLKKPFLPQDIENIIEQINIELEKRAEPANVLDLEEIERIKSIIELNESDEEIIKENFLNKLYEKESFKAKNKKAKKLLKELCKMGKKERKELLDNAKITIKIEFKD